MRLNKLAISALVAGYFTLTLFSQAHAVTTLRQYRGTAAASCQGALPNYEGAIRKRPLSVQNEGTTSAYVTCSFIGVTGAREANLWVNSISGQTIEIKCTGVNGYNTSAPIYVVKSVSALASGQQAPIKWLPADFGAVGNFPAAYMSMSCLLPPGAGINDSEIQYNEYMGG